MWEDNNYVWVVLCKNSWFHLRQSLFSSHRIPLGEADGVMPLPPLNGPFAVRCDECGREYRYKPSDVRRYEQELPDNFAPHPLFRLDAERRRSERLLKKVELLVRGEIAEHEPFQETASALSVSEHGALILLSTHVRIGQPIFLTSPQSQDELEGRVVRTGILRKGCTEVGVEFVSPVPLEFWLIDSRGASKSKG